VQPNIIKFSIKLARLLRHLIFYAGISLRQIEKSFKPSDSGVGKNYSQRMKSSPYEY